METMTVAAVRAALAQSSEMGNFWLSLSPGVASALTLLLVLGIVVALVVGGMMLRRPVVTHWYSRFASAVVTLGAVVGFGAMLIDYQVIPVADSQRAVVQVILEADAYLRVAEPLSPNPEDINLARMRVTKALQDAERMRRQLALLKGETLGAAAPVEHLDLAQLAQLQKLAKAG